jgi:hypothetical protein
MYAKLAQIYDFCHVDRNITGMTVSDVVAAVRRLGLIPTAILVE